MIVGYHVIITVITKRLLIIITVQVRAQPKITPPPPPAPNKKNSELPQLSKPCMHATVYILSGFQGSVINCCQGCLEFAGFSFEFAHYPPSPPPSPPPPPFLDQSIHPSATNTPDHWCGHSKTHRTKVIGY